MNSAVKLSISPVHSDVQLAVFSAELGRESGMSDYQTKTKNKITFYSWNMAD